MEHPQPSPANETPDDLGGLKLRHIPDYLVGCLIAIVFFTGLFIYEKIMGKETRWIP